MTATYQSISDYSIKMRWREPYVTSGINRIASAYTPGCYRGFWIDETSTPSMAIRLRTYENVDGMPNGVDLDSFAVLRDMDVGFGLVIREDGDITISAESFFPIIGSKTLFIAMTGSYAENSITTASYFISDTDPVALEPTCVIVGTITIDDAATTITLRGGSATATVSYTSRMLPVPTAVETRNDYVSGDVPLGLLSGTDRWCIPTVNEKKGLDAAPTAASDTNAYVTEDDTTRKIFAEYTYNLFNIAAGVTTIDLDFATYGSIYIGRGGTHNSATQYFDLRRNDANEILKAEDSDKSNEVLSVYRIGTTSSILPAADADINGFYSSGITIRFFTISSTEMVPVRLFYLKKQTYGTLNQEPSFLIPNLSFFKHDHEDNISCRKDIDSHVNKPIKQHVHLNEVLESLWCKVRGSNNVYQSDRTIASKIFTDSEANLFNSTLESTIEASSWPRVFCYGCDYDVNGARYLMYSTTHSGREQLARRGVALSGWSGSTLYIDVVAAVSAAVPGVGLANWKIVGVASNGDTIYVRIFGYTGDDAYHYIDAFNVDTRTRIWVEPVLITSGIETLTLSSLNAYILYNGLSIIMASSDEIAVNVPWQDLKDGGSSNRGIYLYNISDGSFVRSGYGNADEYSLSEVRASGPMCSDGSNIYFTIQSFNSLSDMMVLGIAQAQISDLTTIQTDATYGEFDTNANLLGGVFTNSPRSLVYDGTTVWMNSRFALWGIDPKDGLNNPVRHFVDDTEWFEFGPAVFDGRNLWFCALRSEAAGGTTIDRLCHLIKFTPADIDITRVGSTSDFGNFKDYVLRCRKWALFNPYIQSGTSRDDLEDLVPFGPIVYDGDTIYLTLCNIADSGVLTDPLCNTLQRLPNIHGV